MDDSYFKKQIGQKRLINAIFERFWSYFNGKSLKKQIFFDFCLHFSKIVLTFAPLICKQKEFRGSVYQDIYRALRFL